MGALAQAMAKAGVVESEKAADIENLRKIHTMRYSALSTEIRSLIREKRPLEELLSALKGGGSMPRSEIKRRAWGFFKMPEEINYAVQANRQLLMDKVQGKLDSLEKDLRSKIKEGHRLETEWGFKRDGSHQR